MPSEDISMTLNVLPGTFAGLTAAAAGMNQIVGLVNTLGNRVGKTTTVLDSMLVTLSAGITYASFQAASAAGDFERSMKMVKAVSGQSAAEIDVLSRKANEFSVSFKMGIDDITEGLQTLGRAGLGSLDTQISVLETGLSAAKLSGLELNKVLQDIVQTTSLLGGDITSTSFGAQADALTDKILSTSMTAPINMNDIVQTLSYSGGTAAAAGINIENEDALYDYLGAVSAFARKGVSGSMAGTALRAFFTKPASQDESVKTAFETIGLQAEDLWKNNGQEMRKVSEQIQIIHDAMNKKHMSTLDQIEIWGKIVGNKMGQQMMKLDESNIRQVTQEIKESESSTKLARESMQNFASDLETLNQRGQAMWREFGNAALTVFRPIVSGLKTIAALISPNTIGGTIFGQLMAGGIIVVIAQVIARLGTALRLVRSIKDELARQVRAGGATVQTIEAQRAKQQQMYQAMGLTQQQSDRLSKHAKETGFNIEFAKTALVEFLAQLNKVVVLMHDLVLQTELLGKAPMNAAVSQQYNRFFASGAGTRPLTKVNYGALTPIPSWYGTKEQGGLYAVAEATPYQSDMTSMAYAHGLEQEFLTQLYTGKVSDKYLKKYNLSSSDVFAKWIDKNPSMRYEYTPKGETATGVMIPLSSLGSFLKEKKLGQQYDPTYNGKAALMEQIGGGTSGVVNINNPKTVTWTGDTSQNTPYYGKYAKQMQDGISTSIKKETDVPQFKTFQDKINNKLYGYPFAGATQTPFLSPDKTTQSAITNALQKTDEAAIKEMEALIAKEMQNENANIDKLLKELEVMESQFKTQQKIGPKTLNQSRDAFVQKYGMTPEQYDKNIKQVRSLADLQEIEKQNQLYKNSLTNMIRTKGGHARWAATYAQDLTDVQNQIRTKREYGSAFYAESQSKNERIATTLGIKGLKGWSDTYIKDMKRLEQVSKQVSQAKGLQFTKAGYITKDTATTQYAKDYNELRKLYSGKSGPLDKNMEAKDIQKVAASQNALIKENSNLIAQYKINEEYMKAFDAELKALTIKEKELNSKLTQQINEIATLDAEIKNTSNALKEFAAILSNPQNQKVLQNRKDEGIVRTHHDELNRLNSEQIKKDREAISKTAQTNATSGIAAAYKDYAKQYTKEKEAELDKLNSARAQNALTGNKVFGPQAPNAYQIPLRSLSRFRRSGCPGLLCRWFFRSNGHSGSIYCSYSTPFQFVGDQTVFFDDIPPVFFHIGRDFPDPRRQAAFQQFHCRCIGKRHCRVDIPQPRRFFQHEVQRNIPVQNPFRRQSVAPFVFNSHRGDQLRTVLQDFGCPVPVHCVADSRCSDHTPCSPHRFEQRFPVEP